MKILMISQDFYPLKGGIAIYLLQLYERYFSKEDFRAMIPKSISKRKRLNDLSFKIKRLDFYPFITPSERKEKNKEFIDYLKKFKPDVVLFGYIRSHPEVIDKYKKINPNVKWGVILHAKEAFFDSAMTEKTNKSGSHKGYTSQEIKEYKKILEFADFLVCVSNFTKKLIEKQGIRNDNVFVVHPLLNNLPKCSNSQKNENFTLLSVGRLVKRKGHDLVLKSLKELRKSIPSIKYEIVGSGPEENKLKNFVEKYNLKNIVNFRGEIDRKELNKVYLNCDIFVLPTKFIKPNDIEGFGIVFIEANSFSKPVIGGKSGGVAEAIEDGKSGFLINTDSKKELIDKVIFLYQNKRFLEKIGKYGRKRVKDKFHMKKNKEFVEFLENIKNKIK